LFTGSAQGTTVNQQDFSLLITTPLVWKMGCNHFVSSIFELTPDGESTCSIDFGSGDCNAIAKITILGHSLQITLQ